MKQHGIPEIELYYAPRGTMPVPREQSRVVNEAHRPDLIFVGSLDSRKGLDLAILAMAGLRQRRGPVLQLNNVARFHGFQANIVYQCPNSDILLMPSRSDVGPLVVPEAMSRGIPIVASEADNVPEMLPDERHGRIASINSIIPPIDAIESLMGDIVVGRFDPSLVVERHRSLFTNQIMAERVDAIYEQVLTANPVSG